MRCERRRAPRRQRYGRAPRLARPPTERGSSVHYLAEFAKELNGVLPTTESSYGFAFLQQGPPMVLSKAFADYRLRKIDGEDVCDHAYLKYHARYAQPATVSVTGTDVEYCRRFLAMSRIPFEFSASRQNDFGQAVSGTFTLSDGIPCEIYIRADYDAPAVVIELLNVGRLGPGRSLLAPKAFDARVVDEIANGARLQQRVRGLASAARPLSILCDSTPVTSDASGAER
jgi:hypothetical protein